MVAGLLRENYSHVQEAISRLAEQGAPNRWIVTTGMTVFGVSCIAFSPVVEEGRKPLFLAGLASLGVAAFPCSPGCPGAGELTDTAHTIAAGTIYVALTAAPAANALRSSSRPYARYSLATAIVAGTALAVHAFGEGPNGLFQRIGLTTNDLWLVVTAARALSRGPGATP